MLHFHSPSVGLISHELFATSSLSLAMCVSFSVYVDQVSRDQRPMYQTSPRASGGSDVMIVTPFLEFAAVSVNSSCRSTVVISHHHALIRYDWTLFTPEGKNLCREARVQTAHNNININNTIVSRIHHIRQTVVKSRFRPKCNYNSLISGSVHKSALICSSCMQAHRHGDQTRVEGTLPL